ncbi:Clavaminate synthase-like protein [Lentinula detonsa]|uniref:Clavaminate synthase-like protein n=1 Tax=Lentinula detonsa TaxID=2804962 RepID=A0AA38Q212_9AGAR|nr:Clavaminate synthase-like protein [Lentinula detonsa]
MSYTALPEFPADIATESLRVVDYELIDNGDEKEMDMLWEAATTLGFWYLINHGLEQMVEKMFDMGEETLSLTMEEKMGYEQESPFGYASFEGLRSNYKTISFDLSEIELVNIAKDDVIAWPKQVRSRCVYPSNIYERMDSTIAPFVRKSTKISEKILNVFDSKLGLPEGFLNRLHSAQEPSASEARTIKVPKNLPAGKLIFEAHTDSGSLSYLPTRGLGGLQILSPGTDKWHYVKPITGYTICNIGDALTLLSGGILHSCIHRVLAAPGSQVAYERWSQMFYLRPGESVMLHALSDRSLLIAEAADKSGKPESKFNQVHISTPRTFRL